jgi:3-hydroxyisobutyrate dehydrogenase
MSSMAGSASRILTMLPSTPQVESVYLDPRAGILAGLKDLTGDTEPLKPPSTTTVTTDSNPSAPMSAEVSEKSMMRNMVDSITGTGTENPPHTILIDQTTLDPTFAMSLAEKIQSETLGRTLMLDAPVSGGELQLKLRRDELIKRNNGGYEWELDDHVWFTIRSGF